MRFIPDFRKRVNSKFHKIFFERFEYRYLNLSDQIVNLSSGIIPNIVYQTWVSRSVPWRLFESIKEFRNLNKNFSFLLFSHEERDKYMKKNWGNRKIYEIYENSVFQPSKADIWRYCVLYDNGGYYFDIKSGCSSPLSDFKISNGAIITYEDNNFLCVPSINIIKSDQFNLNLIANWGFGFQKKHPLLEIIISNIEKYSEFFTNKVFENPKSAILAFTGPGMLTKSYIDYLESSNKPILANGIDFNNQGIYSLKGAEYRYKLSLKYGTMKNKEILKK